MLGVTSDEGSAAAKVLAGLNVDLQGLNTFLLTNYGPFVNPTQLQSLLNIYHPSGYSSPFKAATEAVGDFYANCAARLISRVYARAGVPVFRYRWNQIPSFQTEPALGAMHSNDLAYVFNNPSLYGLDKELAALQGVYWTGFGMAANPNAVSETSLGAPVPLWSQYHGPGKGSPIMVLHRTQMAGSYIEQDLNKETACDFWDVQPVGV